MLTNVQRYMTVTAIRNTMFFCIVFSTHNSLGRLISSQRYPQATVLYGSSFNASLYPATLCQTNTNKMLLCNINNNNNNKTIRFWGPTIGPWITKKKSIYIVPSIFSSSAHYLLPRPQKDSGACRWRYWDWADSNNQVVCHLFLPNKCSNHYTYLVTNIAKQIIEAHFIFFIAQNSSRWPWWSYFNFRSCPVCFLFICPVPVPSSSACPVPWVHLVTLECM